MMCCGIMIQVEVACGRNRRSARTMDPSLFAAPRGVITARLLHRLFAARPQHFRQPIACALAAPRPRSRERRSAPFAVSALFESFEKTFDSNKIGIPSRRLVLRDTPADFRGRVAAVGKHANVGEPARSVARIAIDSQTAGDLAMRAEIGCDHRRSDGQRFDYGQTKAFGEGWHQQSLRMRDEPTECRAGQAVREDYAIVEHPAAFQRMQHRFGTPAWRSDYDELWGVWAPLSDQLTPDVQQQIVIFAGLDCSTDDKVIALGEFLVRPVILKKYGRNR